MTSFACTGYNDQGEFLFISKNSDRGDFHLNTVNSKQKEATPYNSQPLSNITGYPPVNTNEVFGGLCSFSKSSNSFYLSFNSQAMLSNTIANNGTNTTASPSHSTALNTIYQLSYINPGGSNNQFRKTAIQLQNTTLTSFVQVTVSDSTPSLAYITSKATNGSNQLQYNLNVMSLSEPNLHSTKREISGDGILAAGGNQSQHLYLFENTAITEYRFDSKDYTQNSIQVNFNMTGMKAGITGQIYSASNSTSPVDYISIFNTNNAELHIFNHNSSRSNYVPLLWENSYVSFGSKTNNTLTENNESNSIFTKSSNENTTAIVTAQGHNTVSPQTIHGSRTSLNKASSTLVKASITASMAKPNHQPTATATTMPEKSGEDISITGNKHLNKRGLKQNGSPGTSTDGSFSYQRSSVTNEDGSPVSAAILSEANSSNQEGSPYNIMLLSGNEDNGYHTSSLTASGVPVSSSEDSGGIGGGAIAGIVIGVLVSLGIVFGLLIYARKHKNKEYEQKTRSFNKNASLPIQPEDFVAPYLERHDLEKNDSNTSSILQEAKCVPEEYHDGNRPDIRPLCYTSDKIEYASPSQNELLMLEPDVLGPLFLFSGQYVSSVKERAVYLREGYAIRTFDGKDGSKHTVHYFSSANLDTFVRSVHSVKQATTLKKSEANKYILKSDMAIVLSESTPHFAYQYIWITSPMIPEQSLYHLIYERRTQTNIDYHNTDYKIWSIYTILKCIETIHSHNIVHLAIDLKAFYYDHETKPTDWRLGNFGHAKTILKNTSASYAPSSAYTAPEIINQKIDAEQESADLWSTGCVIYTVATGGLSLFENDIQVKNLATFRDDLEQHIRVALRDNVENPTFKYILDLMLRVDPHERKGVIQALDFWNGVYNMEG